MKPSVDALEAKYSDRVQFIFLDADNTDHQRAMVNLGARSTPTVVFFDRAGKGTRVSGLRSEAFLEERILEIMGEPRRS